MGVNRGRYPSSAIFMWGLAASGLTATVVNTNLEPTSVAQIRSSTTVDLRDGGPPECSATSIPEGYSSVAVKITSQEDADALSNCSAISGDLWIQSDELKTIKLDGISQITGIFDASNCTNLQSISARDLSSSYGFSLFNLPHLETLDLPKWSFCPFNISWDSLPLLKSVNVVSLCAARDITLSSTGLESLPRFSFGELHGKNGGKIQIKDNPHLDSIAMDDLSQFNNILIANNGPSCNVTFNEATQGNNISISGAVSIQLPLLSSLTGPLEITNNPSLGIFTAPNLTKLYGNLTFANNSGLSSFFLPSLTKIVPLVDHGYFTVENNTGLNLIKLPELRGSNSAFNLTGSLSSVSMPNINTESPYSFYLKTSVSNFDCTYFDRLNAEIAQQAVAPKEYKYSCSAFAPGSSKDSAKHWSKPHELPKGGFIAIVIIASLLSLFVVILFARWLYRNCWVRPNKGERNGIPLRAAGPVSMAYEPLAKQGELSFKENTIQQVEGTESERTLPEDEPASPRFHAPGDDSDILLLMSGGNDSVHDLAISPTTKERSFFGKMWYGRDPVQVPV